MNTKPVNFILKEAYTQTQARLRLQIFREYINFILYKNPGFKNFEESFVAFKATQKEQRVTAAIFWLSNLNPEIIEQFKNNQAQVLLTQMEQEIENAQVITIYLPFELPAETSQVETGAGWFLESTAHDLVAANMQLGRWFKTNLSEEILIDIRINTELIGGMALSYKGRYKDFSLKSQIDENKQKIIQSLSNYRH